MKFNDLITRYLEKTMKKIITLLSMVIATTIFAQNANAKTDAYYPGIKDFTKAELNKAWDRSEDQTAQNDIYYPGIKDFTKAELNKAWDRSEETVASNQLVEKTFTKAELNKAWDRSED